MVKLKLEIQNESCSPSKKGHKYKARAAARNYTATATLYLYHNQCGDGNHKTLDLQKEIHIELKLPTFSSRWTFNLCAWCRESEVGGLTLRDAYGEMEVINIATTQVQACESDITNVTLSLKGHPCCALPRKLKDCDSYVN